MHWKRQHMVGRAAVRHGTLVPAVVPHWPLVNE
jgi:hypothetical protein